MNISLAGDSISERVVIALAVMALLLQLVGDEIGCRPQPMPMTPDTCQEVCGDRPIKRLESWVCECEPTSKESR